jgi:hypothetical protein
MQTPFKLKGTLFHPKPSKRKDTIKSATADEAVSSADQSKKGFPSNIGKPFFISA